MITELSGFIVVALTIYFEAAFEPIENKVAIANVIRNRALAKKTTYAEECLRPKQFSCWNGDKKQKILLIYDAGEPGIMDSQRWEECKAVSLELFDGTLLKQSFTHYYNPKLCTPSWAIKLHNATKIGNHAFGRLKK